MPEPGQLVSEIPAVGHYGPWSVLSLTQDRGLTELELVEGLAVLSCSQKQGQGEVRETGQAALHQQYSSVRVSALEMREAAGVFAGSDSTTTVGN